MLAPAFRPVPRAHAEWNTGTASLLRGRVSSDCLPSVEEEECSPARFQLQTPEALICFATVSLLAAGLVMANYFKPNYRQSCCNSVNSESERLGESYKMLLYFKHMIMRVLKKETVTKGVKR